MSFYASNDRIYITNPDGKVIFDTSKPMPHIVQEVTATVSVNFPGVGVSVKQHGGFYPGSASCSRTEYVCNYEQVCNWEKVCKNETVCGYKDECNWEYVCIGSSCSYQYVCKPVYSCWTENVCRDEYICRNERVCQNKTIYYDLNWRWDRFAYTKKEWQQTVEIANVVEGIEADFLLVNAKATRTKQGQLADIGALPCGLPLGQWFVANNTSIIECSSDIRNGDPWMTRIMSVFVEGGKIKVQFKHSNRVFESISRWYGEACAWSSIPPYLPGMPPPPTGESSYTFELKIQVGKFTI